jgi:hypothetical protein
MAWQFVDGLIREGQCHTHGILNLALLMAFSADHRNEESTHDLAFPMRVNSGRVVRLRRMLHALTQRSALAN